MSPSRARGVTLMELMVVVAIGGVLASWALPNFRDMIGRTRLKTAASDLHTSLTLARSEAVKRNASVTVSPAGGGTNWAVGWQVKSGSTVLSTQDGYSSVTFTTKDASYATALATTTITFSGTGRASTTSTPASSSIAFILTSSGTLGTWARCVVLDPSGRPAVRSDNDGNSANGCN
jgi:type IV fimbrial biogenesis protein FimT